jgi:hypothetical protein
MTSLDQLEPIIGPNRHGSSTPNFCRFRPSITRPAVLWGIADIFPMGLNRRDVL